jgi:tight adherence protein B
MRRPPVAVVKRGLLIAAALALVISVLTGIAFAGIVVLLVSPFIIKTMVTRAARKQRARYTDQLPSHLQDLAGAMRAGRSFPGALAAVAETADEPTKGEFERVATDEQLGLPLEECLEAVARRMHSEDTDQIALIAALHKRSGSNVAESLERVAEGARDRADLARELKALTGQARLSSMVLSGLPVVLLLALNLIAPEYERPMFHTTVGIVLLIISALMVFAGWKVMNRIVQVEA